MKLTEVLVYSSKGHVKCQSMNVKDLDEIEELVKLKKVIIVARARKKQRDDPDHRLAATMEEFEVSLLW